MNRFLPALAAAILLVAPSRAVAQQDFSDVVIRSTQITPSVYMLHGSGGNIGVLVGEDRTLIVDDQYAPLTERIVAANPTESYQGIGERFVTAVFNSLTTAP